MQKLLLILIIVLSLTSCGEEHTNVDYVFENKSSVPITIYSYKVDINSDQWHEITIPARSSSVFAEHSGRGKQDIPTLFFPNFGDSMVVIFNMQDTVVHIGDTNNYVGNTIKLIDMTSNRCLIGGANYDIVLRKKRRLSHYFDVIYTFTEDDYNFAKE